jgi:hypothetical protein
MQFRVVRSHVLVENSGGCPALARAANGDLLLVHGTVWETIPPGGVIKLLRSKDEGKTWSKPTVIARPKSDQWNLQPWSGLHRLPDGSLMMSYAQIRLPRREGVSAGERNPAKIWHIGSPHTVFEGYVIRSADHGKTWSKPVSVLPDRDGFWLGGQPVTAKDGSVLTPLYIGCRDFLARRDANLLKCGFVRSKDSGATWGAFEAIAEGPEGFNEVTMGVAKNGDIVAILRDGEAGPRRQFRQTVSHDNGKTWDKPKLVNMFGKMPDMLALADGRLLLLVGSVDCMDGGLAFNGPPGTSFVQLFISADNGRTWNGDVLLPSPDPEHLVPFDAPVLARLKNDNILAVSVAFDRRMKGDPLFGWSSGMHYVLSELAGNSVK